MELRPLGSTGLMVTPIGLGLAALGRPGYITLDRAKDLGSDRSVAALEHRSHEVLSAAYDAGIRYFDAARSYGFAERFLASWLRERGLPPKAITVGSKWGYAYVGDCRSTPASMRSRITRSPRCDVRSRRAVHCSASTSTSIRSIRRRWRAGSSTITPFSASSTRYG